MSNPLYDNIKRDPRYAQLVRERARFATMLALLVIGVFFAFVLLVAFVPGVIAQRLSEQRDVHLPPLQVCLQLNVDGGANKAGVPPKKRAHWRWPWRHCPGCNCAA